ncbi:hypothetical protein F511_35504 [Dorcoceras hygrometricum]|uniref:CCHC-type domain-containing protein n=1 Tax=Dorcoceras hygrometricum TaxID=472368 RepID=A0A2Z7BJS3_9LAMI|nr:hypothetical protein F511_35504 [Dorcoceras hygrometricum]
MSLFDLQDVRIAIGSLATLDLPMVVDLIGIYGLKGPYSAAGRRPTPPPPPPPPSSPEIRSGQFDEENPSVQISSGLIVQADEGVSHPVVDLIGVIYRSLPSCKLGNIDPNNTKAGKKYEVKPQYEELSKQVIMQHAIIDAMQCMRAIKDRIARPVYQLENHLRQASIPHTVYQPGKSSMPPRRGRSRTARRSAEESRASESDEDVQQNVPLRRRERQAEVEDVTRHLARGSGLGGVSCGQCGGKHMTSQCRGVQGTCHNCGQPRHFLRVCPLLRGQSSVPSHQGSAGGSSQRPQPPAPTQRSGFQPREPSRSCKLGNIDPNNTKAGKKYEVKPQYEELSKQVIMQHAIIDAMQCMRAIKDRIARPVYQLENHLRQASIPHTVYQPGKSSVRDLQSPSAHHSSVVDTRIR